MPKKFKDWFKSRAVWLRYAIIGSLLYPGLILVIIFTSPLLFLFKIEFIGRLLLEILTYLPHLVERWIVHFLYPNYIITNIFTIKCSFFLSHKETIDSGIQAFMMCYYMIIPLILTHIIGFISGSIVGLLIEQLKKHRKS